MADISSPVNPLGAKLLTNHMEQAKRPNTSAKVKTSEFAKILNKNTTTQTKTSKMSSHPSLYPNVTNKNISSTKSPISEDDGTKIAEEQLREYARNMEKHFMASMWQFAYRAGKEPGEAGIGEALYSGGFIKEMVAEAYGEEGGPMAEAIYENLKTAYKVK